jgi:hypothetical protein
LTLDHHLRGDAGVVGAGLPQGFIPQHSMVTGQGIHEGVLEGMTHVQRPGDIGRGDHDAEGITATGHSKVAVLFPGLVPALFDGFG